MKFLVPSQSIQKHLKLINEVVPTKSSTTIAACIGIKADEDGVALLATDLERTVSAIIDDAEVLTPGSVSVPSKEFISLVNSFIGAKLMLSVEETDSEGGATLIVNTSTSEFRIASHKEQIPISDVSYDVSPIELKLPLLNKAIKLVSFATSKSGADAYTIFSGINIAINSEDTLTLTATNRHVIARAIIGTGDIVDEEISITLPSGIFELLTHIKGRCSLYISGNQIIITQANNIKLTGQIFTERFPDCTSIISAKRDIAFEVKIRDMLSSAERILPLLREKLPRISIEATKDELIMSAQEANIRAREVMPITSYAPNSIKFNLSIEYLVEALSALQTTHVQFFLDPKRASCLLLGHNQNQDSQKQSDEGDELGKQDEQGEQDLKLQIVIGTFV